MLFSDRVRPAFEAMKLTAEAAFEPFVTYFESTWINNTSVPLEMWNVYGVDSCTNNDLEGWHRRFNASVVEKFHPNIWAFCSALQSEQAFTEFSISQIKRGQGLVRANKIYAEVQKNIDNLTQRLMEGRSSELEFLAGIAFNFYDIVREPEDLM